MARNVSAAASSRRVRLTLIAPPVATKGPLYRRVAADPRVEFKAIFLSSEGIRPADMGYGQPVAWDSDLLDGYRATFSRRASRQPAADLTFWDLRDVDVALSMYLEGCDVLWVYSCYNSLTHVLTAIAQHSLRRPVLLQEEQNRRYQTQRPRWKDVVKRCVLPPLFRRSFGLHTGWLNRQWFMDYGMPEDRLFFAPNAVDNERLKAQAARLRPEKAALAQRFGIDPAVGPVILFVGRLIAKKQPLYLLEAFRRVRAERGCSLLFVGSGPMEGELREAIERHHVPNVALAGFVNQSELPAAYACADIFALPSGYREDWGMVVNEAMNFGLPIVITDRVGCADVLVRDGIEGHVVSATDASELTARLRALVASDELRRALGKAAVQTVEEWNYDRAAEGVIEATAAAVGAARWSAQGMKSRQHVQL